MIVGAGAPAGACTVKANGAELCASRFATCTDQLCAVVAGPKVGLITICVLVSEPIGRFAKTSPVVRSRSVTFAPLWKLVPVMVNTCGVVVAIGELGLTPVIVGAGAAVPTVNAPILTMSFVAAPPLSPLVPPLSAITHTWYVPMELGAVSLAFCTTELPIASPGVAIETRLLPTAFEVLWLIRTVVIDAFALLTPTFAIRQLALTFPPAATEAGLVDSPNTCRSGVLASRTSSHATPIRPSISARISTRPAARAVSKPVEPMLAIAGVCEIHLVCRGVSSCPDEPSASATSWRWLPTSIAPAVPRTATRDTTPLQTVTLDIASSCPALAFISARPAASPRISPFPSGTTDTIDGFEDDHATAGN